ncbi:MAG: hypothetical protein IT427_02200 [Pirellulales bacterium]|nr:hypothetical protein [Pirellulales bacterium]
MNSDVVLSCGRLRVVFLQRGDQVGHRIEVSVGGNWTGVLESVEGNTTDRWPSSPALQTLHIESRPAGQVALLVGMAGSSHWSVSIAAEVAEGRVIFDVACRTAVVPDQHGSAYRWLIASHDAVRQALQIAPKGARLAGLDDSELIFTVESKQQRTVRWSYWFQP